MWFPKFNKNSKRKNKGRNLQMKIKNKSDLVYENNNI
jgi:hypothetical protein